MKQSLHSVSARLPEADRLHGEPKILAIQNFLDGFFIFMGVEFYYTYVLCSLKDGKLYIGYSSDVFRRLDQHNAGENISTKARRPFKLIYYEAHTSMKDAIRREKYFKTSSGKRTLKQMLRNTLEHLK